jgi:hypothetical protein
MRFVLIALLLIGCGPGPKSARGDDAPPAKETYTAAVQRYETAVSGLAETVGNTNSELEGIKNELRALKGEVAEIRGLLSVEAEKPSYVPQVVVPEPPAEPAPVKADAPPAAASSDQRITFNGTAINVGEWLATPLTMKTRIGVGTRDTGNRAMVESHLRDHGLEGDFSKYSREQLITLHSVCHMKEPKPVKSERTKTIVQAIIPPIFTGSVGGCPNGQCQRPTTYYYSNRSRRR